jgi:hypothetical protein
VAAIKRYSSVIRVAERSPLGYKRCMSEKNAFCRRHESDYPTESGCLDCAAYVQDLNARLKAVSAEADLVFVKSLELAREAERCADVIVKVTPEKPDGEIRCHLLKERQQAKSFDFSNIIWSMPASTMDRVKAAMEEPPMPRLTREVTDIIPHACVISGQYEDGTQWISVLQKGRFVKVVHTASRGYGIHPAMVLDDQSDTVADIYMWTPIGAGEIVKKRLTQV